MKEFSPETIRNLALIGHSGAGKTSLVENFLYAAQETTRIGKIEEGSTISDYTQNEIERQFSISLSLTHLEWKNDKINILDTPGYSDFIGEVKAGVSVCDTAVAVIKAVEGVEVGTEINLKFVKELNLPLSVIVNKCDNERSRFDDIVAQAKDRISKDVVVATMPANEGLAFDTVVDIIKQKAFKYGPSGSRQITEVPIPDNIKDQVEVYRTELLDKVAEQSEELMDAYFSNGTLTEEELHKGLTMAMTIGSLVPIFATSAAKSVGVSNFLDFVYEFFPSPTDRGPVDVIKNETTVKLEPKVSGEPVLFIFKIISEPHVGELSLFKVLSGKIGSGLDLMNANNGKPERLSQIYLLNGHHRKEVGSLGAGDIGAVVKLKDAHTNNTLCAKNLTVQMQPIKFPKAIIHGAIIPKAKGDEDKIANCLHALHEEDPSFSVKYDPEIAQTIISGQGELHLALAVKRLKERYKVDVDLVEPRIPYRETIKTKLASVEFKHKKQSGGRGQYGHVFFKMEPQPRGTGFTFENAIVGGVVPGRFVPAVEKGISDQLVKGVLAGYNVVDVKVTLFDGSYHDVDSDEMSFKLAASQCFKKGFLEAKPCILEPIYEITVTIPEECMGDVMGDITSRRGKISGMDADGSFQIIKATVPLSELYRYSSTLRSLTGGRGGHNLRFDHYEEVPKEVEGKIIDEYKKSRLEE